MRQNNIALMLGILAVFLVSFSGASYSVSVDSTTLSHDGGSFLINFTATSGADKITDINLSGILAIADFNITTNLSITGLFLNNESTITSELVKVDYLVSPNLDYLGKSYLFTLDIVGNETNDSSITMTLPAIDNFCSAEYDGEHGSLEINDIDISNFDGKKDEWHYLNNIDIEVKVKNTGSSSISDVEVELRILDSEGSDVTESFIEDEEDYILESIHTLKSDDKETVTFSIEDLSSEIAEGTYYLYFMAYSKSNESLQCTSDDVTDYAPYVISIESVEDGEEVFAYFASDEEPLDALSGQENVMVTIPIYNFGEDEQEYVLVNFYSYELGIDEYELVENLDNGDDPEDVSFFFNIPSDLDSKVYSIDVIINFDWDGDEDDGDDPNLEEDYSTVNDKAVFELNVIAMKSPTIDADFAEGSSAVAGRKMTVIASLTNEKDESETYTLSVADYDDWSELISITPKEMILASGETGEYEIVFKATQAGTYTFKIMATDDDGKVSYITRRVTVEEGLLGNLGDATTAYLVVGVLGLLIIILLIAILTASSKKKRRAAMAH